MMSSKLAVIFLVENNGSHLHPAASASVKHWLTDDEITKQPKFVIETSTVVLLKSVGEGLKGNVTVYPCEVLECVKMISNKNAVEKESESDEIGERPQLVRAKSLEDQMLHQSGYRSMGMFAITTKIHWFPPMKH